MFVLAGLYYLSGKAGLSLAFVNRSATAVWPPAGISVAALLLWGLRLWPGVFLGAFVVNLTTQGSVWTALGIASGNTLEAWVAAWLLNVLAGGSTAFERAYRIFRFVGLGAILSPVISATLGCTSLCLGNLAHWSQFGSIWLTWWLGDSVSILVLTPLFVVWKTHGWGGLRAGQMPEWVALHLVAIVVGGVVFLGLSPFGVSHHSMEYLTLPPLLWAAFRLGTRGALSASALMCGIALWGTLHGAGPFTTLDPNYSLLLLQSFMGTITLTSLVLAAVVSERQQAEGALRESQARLARHARVLEGTVVERTKKLSQSNSELEAFCYSLSHDMRAPLRAIQSFTQIVLEERGDRIGAPGTDYLRKVISASERLDRLIQDVLAISRLSRQEIQLEPVALEELVRAIIQERPEWQPPKAEIRIEGPLLPVRAHVASLTQCLTNLLGNAVKFVPAGVVPMVRILTESLGEWVRLWVVDNGIGIEPGEQARIFEMFNRLHSEKQYEGTGIGLAIVRKAMERMGGQVGVESQPGAGSRFWLQLPAANG